MRDLPLGRTGLRVSAMGFGAWSLSGDYGPADDAESVATIRRALELGVTLIDTADEYGGGHNERLVGEAIQERRDEVVLATKAGLVRRRDGSHSACGRSEYLKAALEASLRRLGIDYVDVLYLHRIDPTVPVEESVGAMAELVQAGKARFLGLCEATPELIRRAHDVHPLAVVQSEYSLFTRDPEQDVVPLLRALGVGFVAFSPLGRGLLTGGLRSAAALGPTDFRRGLPRFDDENLRRNVELVRPLHELASAKGVTPAQVALAWLLYRDVVPIPGTRTVKHLEENLAATTIKLSSVERALLDEAFPPGAAAGPRYPATMSALAGRGDEADV